MYVGYVQFPPAVLLVRLPTTYKKSKEAIDGRRVKGLPSG